MGSRGESGRTGDFVSAAGDRVPPVRGRRPWRCVVFDVGVAALTILTVAVLVGMYYGWAITGGELHYDMQLVLGTPVFLMLVVAGLLWWLLRGWPAIRRQRAWVWWDAVAPAVVLTAVLAVTLFPRDGFDEARPRLEAVAEEMLAAPQETRAGLNLDGVHIAGVELIDGAVYFVDADNSFGTTHGWIYSPSGSPESQRPFASLDHLDGPWYEYEHYT